jgi:glucosyl-3-phosphoglycerate synthase
MFTMQFLWARPGADPTNGDTVARVSPSTWQPLTASEALAHKHGQRIAVCLPARNEEATVGSIVATIRSELMTDATGVGGLMTGACIVDELIVIDDGSTDSTAAVAAEAGARVVPNAARCHGKGAALWTSVQATDADLIVWCDADLLQFTSTYVLGLITPLLCDPSVVFVKGAFERPVDGDDVGGRVTELVARPLLHVLHPGLAHIDQPLGGEYAGRRAALAQLPFVVGYGVEMGLLLDVARVHGTDAIAQVELGTRHHRRRKLLALEPQALEVLLVALDRAGFAVPDTIALKRRGAELGSVGLRTLPPPEGTAK